MGRPAASAEVQPFLRNVLLFKLKIAPDEASQYIAGCIILAAAPCTAMVFVWSYLTGGDPGYTLVQVSVNDPEPARYGVPGTTILPLGSTSRSVPQSL